MIILRRIQLLLRQKIPTQSLTIKHFITALTACLLTVLSAGNVRGEKTDAPAQLPGPEAGVNIISVGNSYADPQLKDEALNRLFAELKARGITRISLRVTWGTMERQEGSLNPEILASMKRIYNKAHDYGFKAMLDFHTFFAVDSYACPEWVGQKLQDDGSPCVRSIAMLARSEVVRKRYLAYVAGVISELKECLAIDVISVMNEPLSLEWNNPSRWKTDLDQLQGVIEEAARIVREKAPGRKVAIRFCGVTNPWAHNPGRSFDAQRMLKAMDIIGQNIYIDPDDENATEPEKLKKGTSPSLSWDIVAEAAERCRKEGKEFWITEFGCPYRDNDGKLNLERQQKYFESSCKRYWGPDIRPDAVMAWVLSPNPKGKEANGLYDGATGTFYPAFDVYSKYSLKSAAAKKP